VLDNYNKRMTIKLQLHHEKNKLTQDFQYADWNEDGHIDYEEFLRAMHPLFSEPPLTPMTRVDSITQTLATQEDSVRQPSLNDEELSKAKSTKARITKPDINNIPKDVDLYDNSKKPRMFNFPSVSHSDQNKDGIDSPINDMKTIYEASEILDAEESLNHDNEDEKETHNNSKKNKTKQLQSLQNDNKNTNLYLSQIESNVATTSNEITPKNIISPLSKNVQMNVKSIDSFDDSLSDKIPLNINQHSDFGPTMSSDKINDETWNDVKASSDRAGKLPVFDQEKK